MDGESLVTLIGIVPWPDCLKDLIPKIGLRLKVYHSIKASYDEETNKVSSLWVMLHAGIIGIELDNVSNIVVILSITMTNIEENFSVL